MGGWIAGRVRELEGLENGKDWGLKTRFQFPLHFHTFCNKSFASSRPRQVCLREIVMYPAKLQVAFFILVHLPCIHLLHRVNKNVVQ